MRSFPPALLVALMAAGCGGERCPEVSRLDGGWAIYLEVDTSTVSGNNAGNFPWEDVFVGGWSEWDLAYLPSREEFQLDIDGQPFVATYTADAVDCQTFTLAFDGRYLGDEGSTHDFVFSGVLTQAGVHMDGEFTFDDTWEDPVRDTSGSLAVPSGVFTGNVRTDQ